MPWETIQSYNWELILLGGCFLILVWILLMVSSVELVLKDIAETLKGMHSNQETMSDNVGHILNEVSEIEMNTDKEFIPSHD